MTHNNVPISTQEFDNEDIIDLRFLLGLLKAHKWFIVTIVLICVALGGGYSVTRPPIYESTALIKVNGDSSANASNLMAVLGMSTGAGSGGFMNASPTEIETALIQSEYIMGEVAEQLGLNIFVTEKRFPIVGNLFAKLFSSSEERVQVRAFSVPVALEATPFELVMKNNAGDYVLYGPNHKTILQGKVGQLSTSQDQSISLEISSWKASSKKQFILTKQPTNIIVENLLHNLTIKEQGDKTGVLLVSFKSKEPQEAQAILNAVLKATVEKNIAEKAEEATKTLTFLQDQLPQITQDLEASEKNLNAYRSKTGTIDDQVEAQLLLQEIVSLEKDLNELNLKKLELLENFTPKHPYLVAIDQKQQKMEQQLNAVKEQLRKLPLTTQEAANFQRDIQVHGEIYSGVMQNVQQMEMLKGSTVSSVKILKSASFPVLPIASKTSLILLISLILGLSLSTAILLLQYSLSRALDPLLIEKALGVSVLAVIPFSLSQIRLYKSMNRKTEKKEHYLLSLTHPKDTSIEALRSLRTALKLVLLSGDKKTIAISGCSPNVGKSFVSSNLVALLADLGQKVLLIDADMRKGYMHKIFSLKQSLGLSEYLQGEITLENAIQTTAISNIDLITTGAYPAQPVELLMNQRFEQLMREVGERYDLVLIDTPPVLAVTDASIIFRFVDVKLLLVGLAKDQLKEVEHTKGVLEKAGFVLDGIICNNSHEGEKKYGYRGNYYRYNYQYQYE